MGSEVRESSLNPKWDYVSHNSNFTYTMGLFLSRYNSQRSKEIIPTVITPDIFCPKYQSDFGQIIMLETVLVNDTF